MRHFNCFGPRWQVGDREEGEQFQEHFAGETGMAKRAVGRRMVRPGCTTRLACPCPLADEPPVAPHCGPTAGGSGPAGKQRRSSATLLARGAPPLCTRWRNQPFFFLGVAGALPTILALTLYPCFLRASVYFSGVSWNFLMQPEQQK